MSDLRVTFPDGSTKEYEFPSIPQITPRVYMALQRDVGKIMPLEMDKAVAQEDWITWSYYMVWIAMFKAGDRVRWEDLIENYDYEVIPDKQDEAEAGSEGAAEPDPTAAPTDSEADGSDGE